MKRPLAFLIAGLCACGSAEQIVGVEDLGDADLKVIITRSTTRSDITVIPAGEAYRYRHEPLSAIFDRGDSLQVIVVGLRSRELKAMYRGLPDLQPAELAPMLQPQLGSGEGVRAAPTPTRVLSATIDSGSSGDLEYQNVELDSLGDDGVFGFLLAGADLCPPTGVDFRVYDREQPGVVCVYRRSETCAWIRAIGAGACANEAAIFGAPFTTGKNIYQDSEDALVLPTGTACPLDAGARPALGETHAWRCGNKMIAAQIPPATGPFDLTSTEVSGGDIGGAVAFALSNLDLFFASGSGLYRINGSGDATITTQRTQVVEVESSNGRALRRIDDTHAQLDGASFGTAVSAGQCLEVLGRASKIASIDNGNSATVIHPLPSFGSITSWRIYGTEASGAGSNLFLPSGLGAVRRLSADDAKRLVIFGSLESYETEPVTGVSNGQTYQCPYPLVVPPGTTDLIALESGTLALSASSLSVVAANGTVSRMIDLGGAVPAGAKVQRIPDSSDEHWAISATGSGEVVVVDPQDDMITRRTVGGEVLAFLSNKSAVPAERLPRVLYRRTGKPTQLVVLDLETNNETLFEVPPFDESSAAEIHTTQEAIDTSRAEAIVLYTQGEWGGVLNLTTGRSRAARVGAGVVVRGIFKADSGARWGHFRGDAVQSAIKVDD